MESFLVLISIMSLGTISPMVKNKPALKAPDAVQIRSMHLSKVYSDKVSQEIAQAPAKILSVCAKSPKVTYQENHSGTIYYSCDGNDVSFFTSNNHFYASVSSKETEEGFVVIENELLSRSLKRQVGKLYQQANEQAKAHQKTNNKF